MIRTIINRFAYQMRSVLLILLLLSVLGATGCSNFLSQRNASHSTLKPIALPETANRFQVIYEHGETLNTGGFTILRDNKTGVEYLIVTGLNGAPSVTELKTKP
ncbi:DUF6440 family protein [Desulfurispora thermophila]|uniref:DUF6440 family protein n=1 Tax=Desulfurispora thermophila TaxID=265470 RepID=UPI00035C5126|nr:DUF6440 family protein [Desulfurispora thermophila]